MFSKYSIGLIVLGSLLLMFDRPMSKYHEPLALIGFLLLFAGAAAVFIAALKKEPGQLKVWSLSVFFIVLFVITWADPLGLLRLMTWLKNI
ncbi:MAG: hypothetical protein ACQEV0_01475 [Bacillota bacterium]